MPHVYVHVWTLRCFHSVIRTQSFLRVLTASVDISTVIESASAVDISTVIKRASAVDISTVIKRASAVDISTVIKRASAVV